MPLVRPLAGVDRAKPEPGAQPGYSVHSTGEAQPRLTSVGGAESAQAAEPKQPGIRDYNGHSLSMNST